MKGLMSMGQRLRTILIAGVMAMVGAVAMSAPTSAIKCDANTLRAGKTVENVADCNVPEAEEGQDLTSVVTTITGVLVAVAGIVSVAVIIYGGTQLVISQGDPNKIKTGKAAAIAGVVGLVIAGAAWLIVAAVTASINNGG